MKLQNRAESFAAVAMGFGTMIAMLYTDGWLSACLTLIGLAAMYFVPMVIRQNSYKKRIYSAQGPQWDVHINQVKVGRITDADYAKILLDVTRAPEVIIRQLANYLCVAASFISNVFLFVPYMFFGVVSIMALFYPDILIESIVEIQAGTPEEIGSVVVSIICALVTMATLVGFVSICAGNRFGFKNLFDEAVADKVRRKVGCASTGTVSLFEAKPAEMNLDTTAVGQG